MTGWSPIQHEKGGLCFEVRKSESEKYEGELGLTTRKREGNCFN